jgi:hypothetical protein
MISPLLHYSYLLLVQAALLGVVVADFDDLIRFFARHEETDDDFVELEHGFCVFLHADCLHQFEHVSEGEDEVRDREMVRFVDSKGLHGFLVVLLEAVHLILEVVDERDDCEECLGVYEKDVLVF